MGGSGGLTGFECEKGDVKRYPDVEVSKQVMGSMCLCLCNLSCLVGRRLFFRRIFLIYKMLSLAIGSTYK